MPSKYRGIHPVCHASKLVTYHDSTIVGQTIPLPEPTIVDGQKEWEVEKVLQHCKRGKTTQYLVRWKGFTRDHDSWESERNLNNAKEKINEYLELGSKAKVMEIDH